MSTEKEKPKVSLAATIPLFFFPAVLLVNFLGNSSF
jgi:hypothetical protein